MLRYTQYIEKIQQSLFLVTIDVQGYTLVQEMHFDVSRYISMIVYFLKNRVLGLSAAVENVSLFDR